MFKEREAKITRLIFAFLMFVWLATSSSFVGAYDPLIETGAKDNTVVVNESGYTVNGGTEISYAENSDVYGGVVGAYKTVNGGFAYYRDSTGNTVTVNGGKLGNVYGGYGTGSSYDLYGIKYGTESSAVNVSNNSVRINDGNIESATGGSTKYGNAESNTVTITGGNVRDVYGGVSTNGNSTNNIVDISGGTIAQEYNASSVTGGSASGTSSGNQVNISGGELSGINTRVRGGFSSSGTASNNVININGGNLLNTYVQGGTSQSEKASNNTVIINNGDLSGARIYGGSTTTGTVSDNNVTINGGNLSGAWIYAGGQDTAYNEAASINNNTITITGSPTLDNASLLGGLSSNADAISGNTLDIRTKNIKVGVIAGFDNIYFHLDSENNKSNVANGDTMLTAATANIEGTKITGYVQGDTNLKEGDTVTLLEATTINADDDTTYTGSVADGVSFNHELNVKRDGNKILATVGESKSDDGGSEGGDSGGDEPTPATGSASNNTVTVTDTTYKINDSEETSYSGSKNIYGGMVGAVDATDHIMGGNASSGDASSNTININSGDFYGANVYGGYASTGAASNNTINISGSAKLDNASIYGGYAANGETSSENPLIVSNDKLSTQALSGSDIVVSYPDATDATGAASNNTINIIDAPSLTGASIYGGYAANGGATSGNTLNIYTKNISAKSIGNFDNINFYLDTDNNKSNVVNGDTMLTVETADIGGSKITGLIAGDTNLSENDKVTLLEATNLNTDANTTYASSIAEGVSFNHQLNVTNEGNKIVATISGNGGSSGGDGDGTTLLEQTTVIPTAPLSAPKMITAHIDNTLNWLPSEDFAAPSDTNRTEVAASKELGSAVQTEKPGVEIFGNIGASAIRTNTGNGSYVDSKTNGINLGFSRRFDSENGNRTYIAPLFDFGGGSYESHLASGIKGKGHTHFTTGGVIARRSLKNGSYFEGSFRMGKTTMDFATDDLVQGDTHPHVAYNTSANIWAAHLNVGRRINLSPKDVLNLYGIYFHTHQGGMDAKLTTGETYQFNSVTNQRLRVGARLLKWAKPTSCFYSGLAYQWESAGAANATYKNQTTHNVGASGSSFMIELGWQVKPAATSRIAIDIGAVGWLGHQRGGSAHVKFNYSF